MAALFSINRAPLLIACLFMSGCLSTFTNNEEANASKNQRATLSDLAEQQSDINLTKFNNTKAARSAKLAEIYQQLLTLEPDPAVKTNIEYRLVQINTDVFDAQAFGGAQTDAEETITLAQIQQDEQNLSELVVSYQNLLANYPTQTENEHIHYQLAKALDLQGKTDQSLAVIEELLALYPSTQYAAELNFRRGEIYYNKQSYSAAITAYDNVISAANNDKYLVNSLYMSGWSLFKLNRFSDADIAFLKVFEAIIAAEKQLPYQDQFTFTGLSSRYQNLASDTQRVLSISLSQQAQSASLRELVIDNSSAQYLSLYEHILFENLAAFLISKNLVADAEQTYKTYIDLRTESIWSARFSLALLTIYHRAGRFTAMHELKNNYVAEYGLNGDFWPKATMAEQDELLPYLLQFSDEHARRLYAHAQKQTRTGDRINAFNDAASALATYLALAKLPQAEDLLTKPYLNDEYLYAEANFEAQHYQKALASYESIAYFSPYAIEAIAPLKLKAAYATTLTIRKMLSTELAAQTKTVKNQPEEQYQQLIKERNRLDQLFIQQYPQDTRSLQLATHAAQYSFEAKDYPNVIAMSDFVLSYYGVISLLRKNKADSLSVASASRPTSKPSSQLSKTELKQVQIVSQLSAHTLYEEKRYALAEDAYTLALNYADKKRTSWRELRNLLASSIYFQAQPYTIRQPQTAVHHLLRVGQVVPESTYRVTAEFDAANILLQHQLWQQAIDVLLHIQKTFPNHEYTASIPAKLAQSYEATQQWELAAEQLLILVASENGRTDIKQNTAAKAESLELKREAQYTAAEYYLKAGNTAKALAAYRTYAHAYPQPFNIAQEVRFKMSEFYRESKEPNKQYFWFRKILSAHKQQAKITPQSIQGRELELASQSAFGLGLAHQQTFKQVKLNTPLQKSLKRKQTAMKQAIGYYQQVLSFQLAQYVPQATYNLAEMYNQLAADVMASQRPSDLDELALEEYEILLEELAYPFEEKAIDIHLSNSQRAWQNLYDPWIAKSFARLADIAPALYNKKERTHDVIEELH